jgi:hypothetical protein
MVPLLLSQLTPLCRRACSCCLKAAHSCSHHHRRQRSWPPALCRPQGQRPVGMLLCQQRRQGLAAHCQLRTCACVPMTQQQLHVRLQPAHTMVKRHNRARMPSPAMWQRPVQQDAQWSLRRWSRHAPRRPSSQPPVLSRAAPQQQQLLQLQQSQVYCLAACHCSVRLLNSRQTGSSCGGRSSGSGRSSCGCSSSTGISSSSSLEHALQRLSSSTCCQLQICSLHRQSVGPLQLAQHPRL